MFTGKFEQAYGVTHPVQKYNLHYSCGCVTKNLELACSTPIADDVTFPHECPDCYKGPYGNVWD